MGKAVLIGLDGATFSILDPLMASGVMPFLRDFVAGGVRAPLMSVVPALTPPAWTSLMTGKRPGEHGIFDFFQKEEADDRGLRFATSRDIRSETIWSLASEAGRRVTSLNFPLMFPPPAVDGCIVPGGWMPWRQLRLGCHPPGLFDRLKGLEAFQPRELSLDMAFEEKALEGCASEEYADWIALHTRREQRWFEVTKHLMREEPADLTAVMFDGVDKLQHLCWRFLDESCLGANPSPWERQIRELCLGYFRQLDGLIREIVGLAGPDANVVMASDHGFGASSDIFFVNTWLERHGYLTWAGDRGSAPDESLRVGIGKMARHVFELDWEKTIAYAATPSSQGIHLVRPALGIPGVSPEAYLRVRRELTEDLRRLRHPTTGRPVVAKVWGREEVFAGPFESQAPDLTIILEDDGVVSILRSDEVVKRRPEPVGTHQPEGIFLASGPAFRGGERVGGFSIPDVAPLLLYCLGVPAPADMSGRLPAQALAPDVLRRRPPETAPARDLPSEVDDLPEPEVAYDESEEAVVLKRLAALGYLE